ncbi:hypothetical protein NL676_033768 [Syzygium grande]|nr:hypothetical protein NL676_033768 [Syzygium grande]
MWYEDLGECPELLIEIMSDEQVKRMVQLTSKSGLIYLYVVGEVDSEPGNSECLEAVGNRKQMKDERIGHYGKLNGGKTANMEDRKKDEDDIGELAHQNDFLCLSCQRMKRDRPGETDRVHAKISSGSGTKCASNPGRDPAERGWKRHSFELKKRHRKGHGFELRKGIEGFKLKIGHDQNGRKFKIKGR